MEEETESPNSALEVEKYLNQMRSSKDLATELGTSTDYIKAMKYQGFRLPGGKASIRMARSFLENSDSFGVRKTTKRPPASPQQSGASSDISREPTQKCAQRKPSSGSPKSPPRTAGSLR